MLPTIRVAIVNAHPATRIGLESILASAGITLTLACSTVSEAFARISRSECDVVLVGSPADASVIDAVARLGGTLVPVVVLGDISGDALRNGAAGVIGLEAEPRRIVAALHAAAAGLIVAEPGTFAPRAEEPSELEEPIEARSPAEPPDPALLRGALSQREMELLRHLAEGYTNKEIARVMVLAEDTVKKAVQSLIAKLGAADRTHAVVLALRKGLIE